MDVNDKDQRKRVFTRYEELGGTYSLSSAAFSGTVYATPVGWAQHEVGLVRICKCDNGYASAWSWNKYTNTPIYLGPAPPRKPKPVRVVRPLPPPVQRLESPEQRYFREHGNHPRAQDDVEIVMIKRGGGFNFGRFFFGNK